jgi:hypothetical protein
VSATKEIMMRIFFSIIVMAVAVGLLSAFVGCGGDAEPIHKVCKEFCPAIVSAMDESDIYDIKSTSEAEAACMRECTDSIEGVDGDLQDDVVDCIDCMAEEIGDNGDWDDYIDALEDCEDECFDDDYPDDPNPWDEFYNDFSEDFDEHWSWDDNGGGDVDSDSDSDTDCDSVAADCGIEYGDCSEGCGDDLECLQVCFDDFCWCIEIEDCDSSIYGC